MTARGTQPAAEAAHPAVITERYRVQREIGRGGMATVYLCEDSRDGGLVAVKVLRAELGSAVIVERFLREIQFASELEHPQIPKVLDSGVVGDLPFYVMTFIEGESLRSKLDRVKQLPIEEAVHITEQVIIPTAYAHARGIVHRDLKPGNILIAGKNVFVLDFGIARAIVASTEDRLTSTGVAVGTPAYMSPEQALADSDVDVRSDIYSLACVTYEMIAGIPPFVGAPAQAVMARRFIAPPPPLSQARELVPPAVERAVMKAMCKAPADRWQSVEEFGAALRETGVSPTVQAQQAVFDVRKRKYGAAIAGTAAVAVAIAGGVAWMMVDRDHIATGRRALENWDIPKAEQAFTAAIQKDPTSATARLWQGQLLIFERAPAAQWEQLILKAADGKADLSAADKERVDALAQYAQESTPSRCNGLSALNKRTRSHADDFTITLFLADCFATNGEVVRAATSPSGYAFATSYEQAAKLYQSIIERNASSGPVYATIMPRLQGVLWTSKNRLRSGRIADEGETTFAAIPGLVADTISFVPYPILGTGEPVRTDVSRLARLTDRNLKTLGSLATAWTEAAPDDPNAQEMLAGILETAGQLDGSGAAALKSIKTARNTALKVKSSDVLRLRLASSQVRLLLKLNRFHEARLLSDSAISWDLARVDGDAAQAEADTLRSGLFAIGGRMQRVIDLAQKRSDDYLIRLPSGEKKKIPAELGSEVIRLEAFAAFGMPRDSILALDSRIRDGIQSFVPSAQTAAYGVAILRRPLSLALQVVGAKPTASLGPSADPFINAVRAVDAGDLRLARKLADSVETLRSGSAPGEITMDAIVQQAWLRWATGDPAAAARILDTALRGLSRAPPNLLHDPILASALIRAMEFSSDLAARRGDDATRAKWSAAAAELWTNADPVLKSSVLAGASPVPGPVQQRVNH